MTLPDSILDHLCDAIIRPDLSNTRYEISDMIGRGGMGAVYRARDTQLDREVALKVIDVPTTEIDPLLAEARLLARLEHPGIVAVYDAGVLPDGRSFCVMRLVEGIRLDNYLRKPAPLSQILNIFDKLCDGVAFAHSRNIIHRDLKPENIMVGSFGEVIVLDWGVALWTAAGARERGVVVGTSRYMAPEQNSAGDIDCRADVYALGRVMQDMLPRPAPRPLAAIAARACSDDREGRYTSVRDLAGDVQRFREQLPVWAHTESILERAIRFASRNRGLLLLLLTYVLVRVVLFFLRSW